MSIAGEYLYEKSTNDVLGYTTRTTMKFNADGTFVLREKHPKGKIRIVGKGTYSLGKKILTLRSSEGERVLSYTKKGKILKLNEVKPEVTLRRIR